MQNEIVAGALFLLTFISPAPISQETTSQVKQETTIYAIQNEDTLGVIAKKYYGSPDFWTNIWNDNSWIENPDVIEKNWKIELHKNKPEKPAGLKKELSEKLLEKKKLTLATTLSTQAQMPSLPTNEIKPSVTGSTGPLSDTQISFLGNCESGMTVSRNSGNGYYGAFQFSIGTWNSMNTGYERADLAPLEIQIDATQHLVSRSSIYTQFPGCAAKMRAAGLL